LTTQSDEELASVSLKTLKVAMEAHFGCNLDAQKPLLKERLNAFVMSEVEKQDTSGDMGVDWNDGDGEDDDDDGAEALAGILGDDGDDDVKEEDEDPEEPRDSRKTKGGKRGGGFGAPAQLSTELSAFLGEVVLPRTEVTKRMWAHIKAHNLQVPCWWCCVCTGQGAHSCYWFISSPFTCTATPAGGRTRRTSARSCATRRWRRSLAARRWTCSR